MKELYPHEIFRIEYSKMLFEALRQEKISPANKGEYAIVEGLFDYLNQTAIPLMMKDDWVFEAVEQFAKEYATDCFDVWERTSIQATRVRNEKDAIEKEVADFVNKAAINYRAIDIPENNDPMFFDKASDFYEKLRLRNLPAKVLGRAKNLRRKAMDHERRYLKTILAIIREDYETVLPRVMITIRRVIRVERGLPIKPSYSKLMGISESLDWYDTNIDQNHPMYSVTKLLRHFYKAARNTASHFREMKWESSSNLVLLPDESTIVVIDDKTFVQRYRYFTSICEMGMNAILAAYSEHSQDDLSVRLAEDYIEMMLRIDVNHPVYGNSNIKVRPYS